MAWPVWTGRPPGRRGPVRGQIFGRAIAIGLSRRLIGRDHLGSLLAFLVPHDEGANPEGEKLDDVTDSDGNASEAIVRRSGADTDSRSRHLGFFSRWTVALTVGISSVGGPLGCFARCAPDGQTPATNMFLRDVGIIWVGDWASPVLPAGFLSRKSLKSCAGGRGCLHEGVIGVRSGCWDGAQTQLA